MNPLQQVSNEIQASTSNLINPKYDQELIDYIQSSQELDFEATPRQNIFSPWLDDIPILLEKTAEEPFRMFLSTVATQFQFGKYSSKQQLEIAEAIIKRESYIAGFSLPIFSARHFKERIWNKFQNYKCCNPSVVSKVFEIQLGKNRVSYVKKIEAKFPQMLHSLYRHATKSLGIDETSDRLAAAMNYRARELYPSCPTRANLKINKHRFWDFFYYQGGKLKRPITKPRLTQEHINSRLEWAKRWLAILKNSNRLIYCFLDEKWLYTTSQRKKEKHLPPADFEDPDKTAIESKKIRNRRQPCKVMYLGIVGRPIEKLMDGKIYLKRVSEKYKRKQGSYHQNISPFYEENNQYKLRQWTKLVPSNDIITGSELLSKVVSEYKVESHIAQDLCFIYTQYSITPVSKKVKHETIKIENVNDNLLEGKTIGVLSGNKNDIITRLLSFDDVQLKAYTPKGCVVENDVNCDSKFMTDHIDEIGTAIRKACSFLHPRHPIYLFMDNAGGHGKKHVKWEYVWKLHKKYSIYVEWQVPHSPETNMLDLGVWICLQSKVERYHKKRVMNEDVLASSVERSWKGADLSDDIIKRINERWKLVLDLIVKGKGSNNLVEKNRELKKNLLEETEDSPDSDDEDVAEVLIRIATSCDDVDDMDDIGFGLEVAI